MSKDIVYQYPKSSQEQEDCDRPLNVSNIPNHITQSAMCYRGPYYDCHNKYIFKKTIEPTNSKGYTKLNKAASEILAPYFDPGFSNCQEGCLGVTYTSRDPRLTNVMRGGDKQWLDRPPSDVTRKLSSIYDADLEGYGKGYTSYSDIRSGDITYYIDHSVEDGTMFEPVFGTKAESIGMIYKDPMDNMSYHYDRIPLEQKNPMTSSSCNYSNTCLSFVADTEKHRQDLLSRQFRIRDRVSRTRR